MAVPYYLVAVAGELALVRHPDGAIYRYNMGWGTGTICYQLADHPGAYDPGDAGAWAYYQGVAFDTIDAFRLWWRYDRSGPEKYEYR